MSDWEFTVIGGCTSTWVNSQGAFGEVEVSGYPAARMSCIRDLLSHGEAIKIVWRVNRKLCTS